MMIYLLKENIKFLENREERIIPIMYLTTIHNIHIRTVNIGDLIFDVNGNIAVVNEIISESSCKVMVLTLANNPNDIRDITISSFR